MSRYATESSGTSFKQAPAGNHLARCVEIIDLGTQHGEYQGEPNVRQQILVRWELPLETIDTDNGPAPMLVSRFYTNSLSEKANLRKDLESWRGREFTQEELRKFDLMGILGKPCMVSLIHKEGKARVASVGAVPKGMTPPPAHNTPKAFWLDEYDDAAFLALPEGFQKIIRQSDEWKELNNPNPPRSEDQPDPLPPVDETDDVPF